MKYILLCLALATMDIGVSAATTVQFALFGDTPYSDYERAQLPAMIENIGESGVKFAIHSGDIKNGHSRCDDGVYLDIHNVFDASAVPLIYVPGDNEWTDCKRLTCGQFDPQERLSFLRKTFFPDELSLGRHKIKLERQDLAGNSYPENVRWKAGGVLFIALNMPGGDNNVAVAGEFETRNTANLTWMKEAFALARLQKLRGILIGIQANPNIEADNAGAVLPGFRGFFDVLRAEAAAFPGQIVLVHGDTHRMQIDHPLKDRQTRKVVENFTRVETYGSPFMGWIRGVVDDDDPKVFRFETNPWPLPTTH